MFSSRLYPLFVRAVSFQTCGRTSLQQCYHLCLKSFCMSVQSSLLTTTSRITFKVLTKAT
ncbi:hypothetical protein C7R92_07530 [Brevibacillus porteri]|uniref:Uncharacterized protein n=1 Tax=Brevibacillus porteri TaxID=2126350 RepID=A0ABX5FTD0_9BACL|nr:hypothetical protein C7R92_07530 [Brevibacillus porteri]